MTRRNSVLALTLLSAAIALSCKGPTGPEGPAGPQGPAGPDGPQGPAGTSVAYQITDVSINNTFVTTGLIDTGGVFPGIVCYVGSTSAPGTWVQVNTDNSTGSSCGVLAGVVAGTSGYFGTAHVPNSFVNVGYTLRFFMFWVPQS